MIYFKAVVNSEFMQDYIPSLMRAKAKQMAQESEMKPMNDYLVETYKITIDDVINQVYENYETNLSDDLVIFKLNASLLERKSQQRLSALVRLIDYGNRDVDGVKLLPKLMQYINENIRAMYSVYLQNNPKVEEEK